MMAQSSDRILRRRGAMRIGCRSDGGITDGGRVKRQPSLLAEFPVVESGQFHQELVRVLAIDDWIAIGRLALLKEQRILPLSNGCGFEAEHSTQGEIPGTKPALRHGHEP